MADIRINALATTAASTASDDFIAVDGSANGTRKLNAYSPTFGGNLTVSGTATLGPTNPFKFDTNVMQSTASGFNGALVRSAVSTVGNPTFSNVDDTDTGIYFPAANTLAITTGGTQRLSVDATATTLAGNLTVSGTTGVTATDLILGTSGPSVKSTLSARAPRQGLVFDGTAGATVSVPAFGTTDFTVAVWLRVDVVAAKAVLDGNNGLLLDIGATGTFRFYSRAGSASLYTSSAGTIVAGKTNLLVYSRGSVYLNGVALQTGISDTANYTGSISHIGSSYVGGDPITGFVSALIYNRALSASEVVSLYEAGAPAGADYNQGNSVVTGAWTASGSGTVTSTAVTNFNATATGALNVVSAQTVAVKSGTRVRLSGSFSSITGSPTVFLYSGGLKSDQVALTSTGATITATASGSFDLLINFGGAGTAIGASVSVDRLGLLLAPDAAQAGGGYVWNDQSGNLAQIVLPSSGVQWNLPSVAGQRIRGTTSTNGNQQLLGASVLLPAECQITHVRARARSGTPTITIGTASGGAQIVASVALSTTWLNCTIALTGGIVSSADDIWIGSNSTDVVETDIAYQPLDF